MEVSAAAGQAHNLPGRTEGHRATREEQLGRLFIGAPFSSWSGYTTAYQLLSIRQH